MSRSGRRPGLFRVMLLALTAVLVALVVVIGQDEVAAVPEPIVGEPSPLTFVADAPVEVEDTEATELAREAARRNVQTVYREDPQAATAIVQDVTAFFERAREAAEPIDPPPGLTSTTIPEIPTTTLPTEEPPAEGEEPPAEGEETTTTTVAESTTTTTRVFRSSREQQVRALSDFYPFFRTSTLEAMVGVLNDDFDRVANGEPQYLRDVERETVGLANEILAREGGILSSELETVKAEILRSPPFIVLPGLDFETRAAVQVARADIVANSLQATRFRDDVATDAARDAAAAEVEAEMVNYQSGQNIVTEGAIVEQVHVDAINKLGLREQGESPRLGAMAAVAVLMVLLSAFFLGRVAPSQFGRPKLVALFGLLTLAAAVASRLPEFVPADSPEFAYLLPAPLIGFLGAILFDARTAAVLAVPTAVFTAISTGNLELVVFAAAATLAPVPLVSSVSSRRQLRLAVLATAAIVAPLGAAIAWFFGGVDNAWQVGAIAFVNGIVSGVAALGVLPFLENTFRITTTLTLLDLTDRNHPALRLIEEEAPGTFNHSILVATIAGKAARVIDANPLLAQAAAYYHDLGKTAQPQFFIENQFGVSNPHDEMSAEDSAVVIRGHVTEGLKLARRYGIPPEVAEGIRMHHGTGLMRYFYHRALDTDPEVDPVLFRHHGEKPKGKEMAILMLSDAVEGATRALVQHEDPTSAGIRKVVEQVVAEKVDDGQLDESSLTFGELTRVKEALVDALIAYYHTRIPYPGFPGPRAEPASA